MGIDVETFQLYKNASFLEALKKINATSRGFAVVVDEKKKAVGTLTDGDIRRALLDGKELSDSIKGVYRTAFVRLGIEDGIAQAISCFKSGAINFLPILDEKGHLCNILTKKQLHSFLLQDIKADLTYDFMGLDENLAEHEVYGRPWGFYKTTVMNEYFQSKIICVKPQASLSLQKHNKREEHWIVAHGEGRVQLGESIVPIHAGSSLFIPKDCKHRLTNTSREETLIITEVQIGDYFGEDDIIRYEDIYGRTCSQDRSGEI